MKALTREAQENCANGKNYKRKKYIDDFTPNWFEERVREREKKKRKHKEPCCAFSISQVISPSSYVVDSPVLLCCCSLTTWGHHIHRARCKSEDRLWTLIPSFSLVRSYTALMISNKLCKQYICICCVCAWLLSITSNLIQWFIFSLLFLFLWPLMRLLYCVYIFA